uniref:Resistance to inhibitors of cholinesterase protein 3 N-terminal domain-containing protein n=1 Tax=Dendroctonus ponderosae TaxID=77166 RepID=A0AAR5Q6M4_DENPD
MQSRRSDLNHPNGSTHDATTASSNEEFGIKRTMLVLVIVVGCFAVVWPKIFYPMLVNSSTPQSKQNVGCCDVISELDIDTIKIMSELCGTIIEHAEDTVLSPREIVSQCKKAVIDKCGIDLSAALYDRVSLGHSTKQILEEVRSLNGSLCLKYYFGVAPWKLGVPRRVNLNLDPANPIKQERPSMVNPVKLHPALKERGRAIYGADQVTTEARRKRPAPIIVEGRPGPIPGRRPTIGLPGEIAPSKISNYGLMGVLMPIYTIAFIIFFTYIVKKIVYKKKPINYVGSPLYPPCDSDEQFEEQVFQANPHYFNRPNKDTSKIGWKERDTIVNAVAALLEEVNQAVEEHKNKLPSGTSNEQDVVKINGVLPNDEEQSSVTVLGMETRASCENGGKWSRPDSPVIHSSEPAVAIDHSPSPQQIFLEGSLPPQSQILVADSATEAQTDADDNSSVILAGKMTLSVISLDSEPGNEESSNILPKNESSDEEGRTSSSNISEEFEKIYASDVEDHINNIIEEAENAVLAEKTGDDFGPVPLKTTTFSGILDEMRKEFNLVEDLLQSSGSEAKPPVSPIAEDLLDLEERLNGTDDSIEEAEIGATDDDATLTTQENISGNLQFSFILDQPALEVIRDSKGRDEAEEISVCPKAVEHEGMKRSSEEIDIRQQLTGKENEEPNDLDETKPGTQKENEDFIREEKKGTMDPGSGLRTSIEREKNIESAISNKISQVDQHEERPNKLTEYVANSEDEAESIVEINENENQLKFKKN